MFAVFKDTLKYGCKEEQLSIVQTSRSKSRGQLTRKLSTQRIKHPQQRLRGLSRGRRLGKHVHHAVCGFGGERWIGGAPVDGYDPTTRTLVQYQGCHCHCHGCRRCFSNNRGKIVSHNQTLENRFLATVERTRALRDAGCRVMDKWGLWRSKSARSYTKTRYEDLPLLNLLRLR